MLFDLYARDLGVAIRDAGLFASAARRVDRLDRVNRLQQDFLHAIGHNLRSPLTRILMVSDDLRTYPETRILDAGQGRIDPRRRRTAEPDRRASC